MTEQRPQASPRAHGDIDGAVFPRRVTIDRTGMAAFLYVAAAFALAGGSLLHPLTSYAGASLDPRLQMWFLGWTPHALSQLSDPLLTDRLGAPAEVNLGWNTSMPMVAILAWPLTATAGVVAAYNAVVLVALAGNGLAARAMLRRLGATPTGATGGGLLYAVSPFFAAHALGHVDFIIGWFPPLLVMVLADLWSGSGSPRRHGLLIGGLVAAQWLVSEELLLDTAIMGLLTAGVAALGGRDGTAVARRRTTAAVPWAVLAAAPVVLPYLAVQFLGPGRPSGPLFDKESLATDLFNVVMPTNAQLLGPATGPGYTGNPTEWAGYLGIPLLVLAATVTWRRWPDPTVRAAAAVGTAALILSFGPHLHAAGRVTPVPMPWMLVAHIPLVEDAVPARLTLFTFLGMSVLMASAVSDLDRTALRRRSSRLLLAVAALVTLLPRSLPVVTPTSPAFFQANGGAASLPVDSVALVLPLSDTQNSAAMLWQAQASYRFRMVAGYAVGLSSTGEDGSPILTEVHGIEAGDVHRARTAEGLTRLRRSLAEHGIDEVIVGTGDQAVTGAEAELMTALLGPPETSGGVLLWRDASDRALAAVAADPTAT